MLVETDHTIIGTAGHIDHGKTALIKALTGVDVDTLAEEKRRGITIELGFAFLDVPGANKEIVFIDVPGHEKLVKTMVAGASNIDAVLFVIAADEGINVQTLEHFDILQLLAIEKGVVALTKADLVDADRISAVTSDIRKMAVGTFLEGAPIIPASSVTGLGVEEVKAALRDVARSAPKRRDTGIFRMPIDRAFTIQGFGTVIAGTILSGQVEVGHKLEILPEGLICRVRGIQVHAKDIRSSGIGIRTAVNLQDIKKEQLRRGQTAVAPGSAAPTTRLDTQFHLLGRCAEDVGNRRRIRFHVAADEVIGRLVLLDRDRLSPGESALAQFVLESPTVALPKDRFVVRTFSSLETIGGGVILDAHPAAHKRFDVSVVESLEKLRGGLREAVEQVFVKSGFAALSAAEAARAVGESEEEAGGVVRDLVNDGSLIAIDTKFMCARSYKDLEEKLVGIIEDYYERNPYRVFMPLSDLQSRFAKLADRQVCTTSIANLNRAGTLRAAPTKVGLAAVSRGGSPASGTWPRRSRRFMTTPATSPARGRTSARPGHQVRLLRQYHDSPHGFRAAGEGGRASHLSRQASEIRAGVRRRLHTRARQRHRPRAPGYPRHHAKIRGCHPGVPG